LDQKLTRYSALASSIARGEEEVGLKDNDSGGLWPRRGTADADMEEGKTDGGTSRAEHIALETDISSLLQKVSRGHGTASYPKEAIDRLDGADFASSHSIVFLH
jgi:hypothetical protein